MTMTSNPLLYKKKIFKEVLTIQRKAACGWMTNTDA